MGKRIRNKISKKAQVSMEFVFLVGVAFSVMLVFVASTRSEFDDLRSREEMSLVKDVTVMVQHELIMASGVDDGYTRIFEIPEDLEGIDYNIGLTDGTIIANTAEYEYVMNIPVVVGDVRKGSNMIRKEDGTVYLNQ